KLLAQGRRVRTKGSFGVAKLKRPVTCFIQATVGGGLEDLLSYLEERLELAFDEGSCTLKFGERALDPPGHRWGCEGFIDERVKLSNIVNYPLRLLLRLGPCSLHLILRDSRLPQQPQYDQFVPIRTHIKVGDQRPQGNVILGDGDDLIHELMLQPCGNAYYHS